MADYRFEVSWSEADGTYVATCPDFPGVSGIGATRRAALAEAELSLELAIGAYQEEGWPLPATAPAPAHSGRLLLRLPRSLHGRLAAQAEREGVSLNALVTAYLAEHAAHRRDQLDLSTVEAALARLRAEIRGAAQASTASRVTTTEVDAGTLPFVQRRDQLNWIPGPLH